MLLQTIFKPTWNAYQDYIAIINRDILHPYFQKFCLWKNCLWKNIQLSSLSETYYELTNWGRVMHICVSKLTIIGLDSGWSTPSHYLNQCWNNINLTLGNEFPWNFSDTNIFSFKKMHLKISSAKVATILYWLQCVKLSSLSDTYDFAQWNHQWLRQRLVTCSPPTPFWINTDISSVENSKQNTLISTEETALENVMCKMSAIFVQASTC